MDLDKDEFFKLDQVDRKLLSWMMDHSPDAISSWLEYMREEYKKKKNIEIDIARLKSEIEEELNLKSQT